MAHGYNKSRYPNVMNLINHPTAFLQGALHHFLVSPPADPMAPPVKPPARLPYPENQGTYDDHLNRNKCDLLTGPNEASIVSCLVWNHLGACLSLKKCCFRIQRWILTKPTSINPFKRTLPGDLHSSMMQDPIAKSKSSLVKIMCPVKFSTFPKFSHRFLLTKCWLSRFQRSDWTSVLDFLHT